MRICLFAYLAGELARWAALGAEEPANLLRNPGFETIKDGRAEDWSAYDRGYARDERVRRSGTASIRCSNSSAEERSGASALIRLDQTSPAPILVTGWSKAEKVSGFANNDYSIYVDLEYMDGTPLWGQTAPFAAGTHDWQRKRVLIVPTKPLRLAHVYALFRHHTGTVWFDDFTASQLSGNAFFDSQPLEPPELKSGETGGWFARDVAADSRILPLGAGENAESVRKLAVRLSDPTASAGGEVISARIEDLSGKPRAITVYYAERFDSKGPIWWNDIRDRAPVGQPPAGPAGERANLTRIGVGATGMISLYPFGCVTAEGKGRMVGIPPSLGPRVARIGYHSGEGLLYVAMDLALTPENLATSDGRGRARAEISVVRSDVDPQWGFRAAAAAYYRLFPQAFERRALAEGIWIPFTDPSKVERVEDFGIAYHEGDNSIAGDDKLGILSFRYTEPMTWWMPMPKGLPRTYDEALALVRRHAEGKDEGNRRWAQALLNSGTFEPGGRFNVEFQNAPWTDGAVWVLNPSPRLPHPPDQWTKGRLSYTKEMGDAMYGSGARGIQDGEYLDSIEGWADVLDFRPESIAHSRSCPTFTMDEPRPVIPTWFSVWDLASTMSDDLHRRGKLLMANATPWRLHAFAPLLDVMGTETNWLPGGEWRPDSDAIFNLRRTLCHQKPYLLLQNTDFEKFGPAEVEKYFQRSLFYGVYPSMFSVDASTRPYWGEPRWYNRDRHLFKKYIPAIQVLSKAGWEPITHARSDHPRVHVERFGTNHLTALNDSGGEAGAEVTVEIHEFWHIPAGASVRAVDLLSGEEVAKVPAALTISFRLTLRPEEARALELVLETGAK